MRNFKKFSRRRSGLLSVGHGLFVTTWFLRVYYHNSRDVLLADNNDVKPALLSVAVQTGFISEFAIP